MAHILVVEDEADIRNMFRDALTLRGHHVDVAEDAHGALELAATTAYDVAIIDYVLPGLRGLDLLRRLHRKHRFMRSIIISGQIDHDTEDVQELETVLRERIAADRYLPKPVSVENLTAAIDEVLRPITGGVVDWKRVAGDAMATRRIKEKDVREVDRALRRKRKKRRP